MSRTTHTPPTTDRRTRIVLAVLFTGAFVMGCAEMLVVGLLDLIAVDLEVSVPAAGALVTANAVGQAFGGPLLTLLATRFDRRRVLLATLIVFVLVYLLPVIGADYSVFFISRVIVGAVQGLFIAGAFVTATSIVPPERSGRAMAIVVSGFATSSAIGLPVGTLLGQSAGWRWSFAAVVAVGVVVLAVAAVVLPAVPSARDDRATGQVRAALAPRVLAVLGLTVLIFTAIQSGLTYLVPFLNQVTGVSGPLVTAFLLAYGAATAIGSFGGGRFADWNAARSLVVGSVGITVALLALHLLGENGLLAWLAIFALGLLGMGMAPSMQHRVTTLAGAGAPLAASLPASAANAGIAIGSLAGGAAIGYAGVPAAIVTGAVVAVLAVAAAWLTSALRPAGVPAARPTNAAAEPAVTR